MGFPKKDTKLSRRSRSGHDDFDEPTPEREPSRRARRQEARAEAKRQRADAKAAAKQAKVDAKQAKLDAEADAKQTKTEADAAKKQAAVDAKAEKQRARAEAKAAKAPKATGRKLFRRAASGDDWEAAETETPKQVKAPKQPKLKPPKLK